MFGWPWNGQLWDEMSRTESTFKRFGAGFFDSGTEMSATPESVSAEVLVVLTEGWESDKWPKSQNTVGSQYHDTPYALCR
jgi:hypothetical protein